MPKSHRPLKRPDVGAINQIECPPTPTHRPKPLRPLPICPAASSSLKSEEPLPACKKH